MFVPQNPTCLIPIPLFVLPYHLPPATLRWEVTSASYRDKDKWLNLNLRSITMALKCHGLVYLFGLSGGRAVGFIVRHTIDICDYEPHERGDHRAS